MEKEQLKINEKTVSKFLVKAKDFKECILPITAFSMIIGFNTVNGYLSDYGIPFPLDINLYALFFISTFYSLLTIGGLYFFIALPKIALPRSFNNQFRRAIGINDDLGSVLRIANYLTLIGTVPVIGLLMFTNPYQWMNLFYILIITLSVILNIFKMIKCKVDLNISYVKYLKNIIFVISIQIIWLVSIIAISALLLFKFSTTPYAFLLIILVIAFGIHFLFIVTKVKFSFKVFTAVILLMMLTFSFHQYSGSFFGKYLLNKLNIGGGVEVVFLFNSDEVPQSLIDEKNKSKKLQVLLSINKKNYVKIEGEAESLIYTIKDDLINFVLHEKKKSNKF